MTRERSDTTTPPAISESMSFLLAQICKAHRNKAQELLAEVGLHAGQEMLLQHLWEADGMTQSQLAEDSCVQPATLTRSLDRLERDGLLERRTDADDQRVSRVYLTAAGRALRQPVERAWATLEAASFTNLTSEERVLLRRLLMQVQANLQPEMG